MMRKRPSRRRLKAHINRGDWIPWCYVVNHSLIHYVKWERQHDRMVARKELPERHWVPITYA